MGKYIALGSRSEAGAGAYVEVMRSYVPLENFWKRYNKALLDRVAVEKERSVVAGQNQQLRALMKQYLDSISVSDEVLSKANALLIVNSRTNVPYVSVP